MSTSCKHLKYHHPVHPTAGWSNTTKYECADCGAVKDLNIPESQWISEAFEKSLQCPLCNHRLNTPYADCPKCGPKKVEPYGPGIVKLLDVTGNIEDQYLEDIAVSVNRWMQTYGATHKNLRIAFERSDYDYEDLFLILTGEPV